MEGGHVPSYNMKQKNLQRNVASFDLILSCLDDFPFEEDLKTRWVF